jgi:putative selenium metabolism protein SsnA
MLASAIRQGTTTLIDHHASPRAIAGSLDAIAGAVLESGLRACLCYEVSDRDGEPVAREGIEENARFIRRCLREKNGRLRALFGLHASFTLSDATLDRAAAVGQELSSGFHIHVAEARSDQEHCQDHFGMRVVERLHRHGILGRKTLAAHCVHVDEVEMDRLAETETMVVHNPQSNLNNAVGIADVIAMRKKGIVVGLGTDAMTVDMLEEMRAALWSQRHLRKDPSCGFADVTSALTEQNPRIATRLWGVPLGWIGEGVAADLIVVDYKPPTPLDDGTARGHLLYGISQCRVDTTIVAGRVLMENGKLTVPIDEERAAVRARERAAALWRRF